jgi:hypothetical protein
MTNANAVFDNLFADLVGTHGNLVPEPDGLIDGKKRCDGRTEQAHWARLRIIEKHGHRVA